MRRTTLTLAALIAVAAPLPSSSQQNSIVPAHPTHYFYTPAPYVNPPHSLVIGLHELSYAFPYNLQLQASLFDNIGRINAGAKFGILDDLSAGAGLAWTLVHLGRGNHGIPRYAQPRFGMFVAYGPVVTERFEMTLVPHSQIGERVSVGFDYGMFIRPNELWGIITEIGTSFDFRDELLYLNFDGGLRFNPRSIPFLHFDIGVDLEEFPVVPGVRPTVTIFGDVIFAMVTAAPPSN
ncbi:MAG: hypothetical protein GF331_22270 [Chitinivibrionales bacterium]|nr:hypothetical protein [Chitinivibrionales bacterium]